MTAVQVVHPPGYAPERAYAAVDIFMCGACDPYRAVPLLKEAFRPKQVQITEAKRGIFA